MKVWQALCKLKGRTHSTGRCTEEKIVCEGRYCCVSCCFFFTRLMVWNVA
jgi:hypothetical protein